ncbi:MAG: DUF2480 family protein [Bacteroidetes bacterium]|jgi:hypothetical protein|nr:DUF2480 family protein [Bacteroidota bacterium]
MSTKEKPLVNRVKKSPLKTINLEEYYPDTEIIELDVKDFLFKGLLLREKEFRASIADYNWEVFENKILCVHCSTDAIVPVWSYMLIASKAAPFVKQSFHGRKEQFLQHYFRKQIESADWSHYKDGLIVIKGCSEKEVPQSAYLDLTVALQPFAKSIMFGEACSTVPVYKKKKS